MDGGPEELEAAVGIVKRAGGEPVTFAPDHTWMAYWEPEQGKNGHLGVGVVLKKAGRQMDTAEQVLLLVKIKRGETLNYLAGAGWSKSGDFPDRASWVDYVRSAK